MEATDKKKYWNDQIKSMLGPCMITFAIPLTVPGLTITLVAFSEDTTFETYGVIHIVGILFLATAVILLILGCMLRMLWKPTIGPDIEMHLTPLQSVTSVRNHKKESQHTKINNIYSGARVGPEERVTRNSSRYEESHPKRGQTVLSGQATGHSSKFEETFNTKQKENKQRRSSETEHKNNSKRDTSQNDKRLSRSTIVQDDSPLEETGSDSESAIYKNKYNRRRSADSQGRGEKRHTNDNEAIERFPLEQSRSQKGSTNQPADETCLDEIQQWRQKKKSKQKSKVVDTGIINAASDCEDTIMSRPLPKLQLNERPLSSPNLENGNSTGDETNSGQSARSPHQSLLQHDDSLEKKKRRKKKRASKTVRRNDSATDNANDTRQTRVLPPVLRGRLPSQSDGEHHLHDLQRSGSSDTIDSIGSADSVLAQYTSRNPDV